MRNSLVIAMVGPNSLRDAYSVLLHSAQKVDSLVYASRLDALREIATPLIPDLVILHVARSREECKAGQIVPREIEHVLIDWPDALTVALVDDPRMRKEVGDQGIDLSLLEGISPTRFLQSIEELLAEREAGFEKG